MPYLTIFTPFPFPQDNYPLMNRQSIKKNMLYRSRNLTVLCGIVSCYYVNLILSFSLRNKNWEMCPNRFIRVGEAAGNATT